MQANPSARRGVPRAKRGKKYGYTMEILGYNLMTLPGVVLLIIFAILPMFGVMIAFQDYVPAKGFLGSEWVGMENFELIFSLPDSWTVLWNTVVIALWKMAAGLVVPIVFALMLNEVRSARYRRLVQTVVYMPNFISWVILGEIFCTMLSTDGIVNDIIRRCGGTEIMFMASNRWARPIMVITETWKGFGYGAVIYMAALSGIDQNLYEAAVIDGASRMQQVRHVTLPGLAPTIVLVSTLSLSNVLNAGFDQIYNMYNPLIYETVDIIDTFTYRLGLVDLQFSLSTAVGLFKSVVSFLLISLSYFLAYKTTGYRIY